MTVEAILAHEAKFQHFGELSTTEFGHPTRVDGSVGFRRSVQNVRNQLEDAGYRVTVQRFRFDRFVEKTAPVFEQVTPNDKTYAGGDRLLHHGLLRQRRRDRERPGGYE